MAISLEPRTIDEDKLEQFLHKLVGDFGAAMSAVLGYMGDKLGLYTAMADSRPVSSEELARRTGLNERYVREWLLHEAAAGYIEYDPIQATYTLPPEHALPLTDESSEFYVAGGFQVINGMLKGEPLISDAFRTGKGVGWGEHHPDLFHGTERFFRPGYRAHIVQDWIPALDGVQAKLERGAKVADVGCGHGASTIIMAQAYPNSRFYGFDYHAPSIERARQAAKEAGIDDRVQFELADCADFRVASNGGSGYDLICFFDCFHDLNDPDETAAHVREALAPDGTVMMVEPMAGASIEENINPVGRVYTGASVLCCTPCGLSGQEHGPALGTVATDERLSDVWAKGGLRRFRRVAETPFNRVFEVRH